MRYEQAETGSAVSEGCVLRSVTWRSEVRFDPWIATFHASATWLPE